MTSNYNRMEAQTPPNTSSPYVTPDNVGTVITLPVTGRHAKVVDTKTPWERYRNEGDATTYLRGGYELWLDLTDGGDKLYLLDNVEDLEGINRLLRNLDRSRRA